MAALQMLFKIISHIINSETVHFFRRKDAVCNGFKRQYCIIKLLCTGYMSKL